MSKHYINVLRFITGATLTAVILVMVYMSIQSETVGEIKPYPSPEKTIPKNCWNGGAGHPYPSRVKYNGEMRGQKVVDSLIGEMFGNRPGPYNTNLVEYFCK